MRTEEVKSMKLIFLSHLSDCSGGAQRCLLDLLKGIKFRFPDWQVYIVFPCQGDLIDACSPYIDGYMLLRMEWWLYERNDMPLRRRLHRLWKSSMKLVSYLRKIKPDYGITNTIVLPHLALACRILGVKHSWFIHEIPNLTWLNFTPLFNYRFLFRIIDRLSVKILVTSECVKYHYQKVVTRSKVRVINQAVELSLEPGIGMYKDVGMKFSILLVGAFDSNKGQMELLQAVKRIVDAKRYIFCYLVGPDAGFMSQCQDYVRYNGLDENVKIVPYTKQIASYYALADVVLVCSGFETFGRVAVEAQKCGLPVILSDVGANPERIEDGVNGLLYQKGNVADLVEKIEWLRDEKVRRSYSDHIDSVMLKEKYSIESFASSFCTLLGL